MFTVGWNLIFRFLYWQHIYLAFHRVTHLNSFHYKFYMTGLWEFLTKMVFNSNMFNLIFSLFQIDRFLCDIRQEYVCSQLIWHRKSEQVKSLSSSYPCTRILLVVVVIYVYWSHRVSGSVCSLSVCGHQFVRAYSKKGVQGFSW